MTSPSNSSGFDPPVSFLITPGNLTHSGFTKEKKSTLDLVRKARNRGVSFVQIREKNLPARLIADLSSKAVEIVKGSETGILVNDRLDIALAVGAAGVHLTGESMRPADIRRFCPESLLIGVSTHSVEEVISAQDQKADYVFFGPVFDTPAKRKFGRPKGLDALKRVCNAVPDLPVIAVGGIDGARVGDVIEAGATGFAAIRYFEEAFLIR
ncbi:MAG: thiamine phosphate synthase [Pyrinomonadaceae bacterium]|nr:thiamine phosphate synthase [Pyrinomonadaceae bacterium]